MDSFPYDSWDEALAAAQENGEAFFTFGSGGAIPLTILGAIAMVVSLVMFVTQERRNLEEHAARYREEGVI